MPTLEVIGVRIDTPTGAPILLLKDKQSPQFLPLWIGAAEASAIAHAIEGIVPPRPMTHDLLAAVLRETAPGTVRVEICGLSDGVFSAALHIGDGVTIDARPSDLVALALRLDIEITCPDTLMVEAGVELLEPVKDEVEAFRDFLDHVNPDDFEG